MVVRSSGFATEGVAVLLLIQLVDRRRDLGLPVRPHADVLLVLQVLSLALEGRRDQVTLEREPGRFGRR